MVWNRRFLGAALFLVALPPAAVAQAGEELAMSEAAAVRALMDNRLTPERDRALALALELGPRAGPELRAAVIAAAWAEIRGETNRPEGETKGEAIGNFAYAVAGLRDRRGIPFLIELLPNAPFASRLAEFDADVVFPPLIEAAADPGGHHSRIAGCLEAFRLMIEDGSLSERRMAQVREVARERLAGTQHRFVVTEAMRVGAALRDPGIRQVIERVAADRAAAEALVSPHLPSGEIVLDYPSTVDRVQETARALLGSGGR